MIASGIHELDRRLGGGLMEGRFYILSGSPGSGKTSACIHFLCESVTAGESCAILTQENPADLMAQGEFLGCDLRAAAEEGLLAVLQYRLDFAQNYARVAMPQRVADEFSALVGDIAPRRIVVDTILPLLEAGTGPHGAANALLEVMERNAPTAFFTVPGDVGDSYYARAYDTVISGAAGIFHFALEPDGTRRLEVRKTRHAGVDTTPLRFDLRAGAGIVPARASTAVVPDEISRRLVLVDASEGIADEVDAALRQEYDVARFESMERALGVLTSGSYGVLLMMLDPMHTDRAFEIVRSLRANGNGAPILFISSGDGLRGSTRARGLRAGADDFVSADLTPHELLARVEAARRRGHQPRQDQDAEDVMLLQPSDSAGDPLPIDEPELARAVRSHIAGSAHPFFALVELETQPQHSREVWTLLSRGLRLGDGDLIARTGTSSYRMYLHDISRRRVEDLVGRILATAPAGAVLQRTIRGYPTDAPAIEGWLRSVSERRVSA